MAGGSTLLHISDLHFGGGFADRMADAVLEAAERIAPDAVIASGDLVEWAEQASAWRRVARFFSGFQVPLISVPGNHDLDRVNLIGRLVNPFRAYRKHIHDQLDRVLSVPGAHLVGLTSASRWNMDLGWLSRRQIEWACDSFAGAEESAARVLVVHHGTRSVWKRYFRHHLRGSKNLENPLFDTGVDLILTGHRHFWHTEQLEREDGAILLWSQAGTATCARRHPAAHTNSFSVVKTAADRIAVGWWHFTEEGRFELAEEKVYPRRVPAGLLADPAAGPRRASG